MHPNANVPAKSLSYVFHRRHKIYIATALARSYHAIKRGSLRLIEGEMDQPQVAGSEPVRFRQKAFKPSRQARPSRETLPVTSTANTWGMA